MPEARDRVSRLDDVTQTFSRRQRLIGGLIILADEPAIASGTPVRWGTTPFTGSPGSVVGGRGNFGTPRNVYRRGRNLYRSPASGRQNTPPVGSGRRDRGRGTNGVLPSWYPRRPLHDITAVVRAFERRRARLRETEGQLHLESPIPQDSDPDSSSVPTPGAQLEHEFSTISPSPNIGIKPKQPPSFGKVPQILLNITKKDGGESDLLTPQKKLLNSIDSVEKVVMEELHKLKRTPAAKRAEREKRVRTLMSMR